MERKQLALLFIVSLVPNLVGGTIIPLLPIYIGKLGADGTITGIYLALGFAALAAGSLGGGYLSERFQSRRVLIIWSGIIGIPGLYLHGQISDIVPLTILTMFVWFTGGLTIAAVYILTGMFSEPTQRGRMFGIIGMTTGLGQFVGGMVAGPIVDNWGFEAMFTVVASFNMAVVIAGYMLADRRIEPTTSAESGTRTRASMGLAVWLLIVASVLANAANGSTLLGRPILMDSLKFDATAISVNSSIGGIFVLPLPLIVGWLSDRIGRKGLLILVYGMVAVGGIILANAFELWNFWLSTVLFASVGSAIAVGSALITDIVDPQILDSTMARYTATTFVGGVIGLVGTGTLMRYMNLASVFYLAAGACVVAVILIYFIRQPAQGSLTTK